MAHQPTEEQEKILTAFATGESLKIEALAGTGKTTALRMLSEQNKNRRGLYLAYNRVTSDEAKAAFPPNVECSTVHSLAYRAVGYKFKNRLAARRVPPWEAAKWFGIYNNVYLGADISIKPMVVASYIMRTVQRFCYSGDSSLKIRHVPLIRGAEEHRDEAAEYILPRAQKAWDDLQQPDGYLRLEHDHYLKMYALTKPQLPYDFILMDESQDCNRVVRNLYLDQRNTQKVAVGDEFQSLYAWRGSVDFLSEFNAKHHLYLTKSFRFGPAIAKEGQKWLSLLGSSQVLKGHDPIESSVGSVESPDAVLCRTNADVVLEAVKHMESGKRVAIVGGTADLESWAKAAEDLKSGKGTNHHDIAAFKTWSEVQEYSKTTEGSDLRTFVALVDQYGTQVIKDVARLSVSEEAADVVVSTGHRSKGREWDKVAVSPNFYTEAVDPETSLPSSEFMMLAYVSVTRAKHLLCPGGLSFVDKLLEATQNT